MCLLQLSNYLITECCREFIDSLLFYSAIVFFFVRVCVCVNKFISTISYNSLMEISWNVILGALGNKAELNYILR